MQNYLQNKLASITFYLGPHNINTETEKEK